MKRSSTVQKVTYHLVAKIAAYMAKQNCGWIIRVAGQELGVVAISGVVATTDQGQQVQLVKNKVCVRKIDFVEIALQDRLTVGTYCSRKCLDVCNCPDLQNCRKLSSVVTKFGQLIQHAGEIRSRQYSFAKFAS